MTPEEKEEAEEMKELMGPPIDVEATLSANLHDKRKLLNAIQEYVEDVQKISKAMKGFALMNGNMHAYVSAQSAIDVSKDVLDLIAGKRITTIAEMEARLKKEKEELDIKLRADGQEAYTG